MTEFLEADRVNYARAHRKFVCQLNNIQRKYLPDYEMHFSNAMQMLTSFSIPTIFICSLLQKPGRGQDGIGMDCSNTSQDLPSISFFPSL